jgi:IclR family transcriptional regulator, KDG regulon repressor
MSVLEKATQALDYLGESDGPRRLAQVAASIGVPKSSAHRLLTELSRVGIVWHFADGRYGLGPRLLYYGAVAARSIGLREMAEAPVRHLRATTGESVHLYIPQETSLVCILSVEGTHSLRPFVALGRPRMMGFGSSGKLTLAYSDDATRKAARAAAQQLGRTVPTSAELDQIRADGWVTSIADLEPDLAGIAVAVTDGNGGSGGFIACLTISGSTARLTSERLLSLRGPMQECAELIATAASGRTVGARAAGGVGHAAFR